MKDDTQPIDIGDISVLSVSVRQKLHRVGVVEIAATNDDFGQRTDRVQIDGWDVARRH